MKRIQWAALACLLLMLTLLPAAAFAADQSFEIIDGGITVTADGAGWKATQGGVTKSGAITDTLTIAGTGTAAASPAAHAITIASVGSPAAPLRLVLHNVHIQTAYDALTAPDPPNPLDLQSGSHVALTLTGANTLAFKGDIKAAVHVPDTSSLTVTGDGSLTAECILLQTGAVCMGAAIGGNGSSSGSGEACGTVKISGSANVTATCDTPDGCGAGIGGGGGNAGASLPGMKGGDGGTVEVSGQAIVTARSSLGAGVGGGAFVGASKNSTSGNGGTVTVNGGSLTAVSTGGAGIGSGHGSSACGSGGSLTVQNGTVTATGTNGAGVGGGASTYRTGGNGGSVTMTGGELRAKSTNGAAVGGGHGTAIGTGGSVDLGGFVDLSGNAAYEWSRVENVPYTVCADSDTAFPNNNALGFAGIRGAGMTISPITLDFGTQPSGYTNRPGKQSVTLTNTGTGAVTPQALSSTEAYEIETPSDWGDALNAGDSRVFSVQPKAGLSAGDYAVTLPIRTNASTVGLYLIFGVGTAPTISGPQSITLPEGYGAPQYIPYTTSGNPAPYVGVDPSGLMIIVWDDTSNQLKINTGLAAGMYNIVLEAYNSIHPNAKLPVTLTVTAPPTIGITPSNTFPVGSCGGDYEAAIGAGTPSGELNINHLGANDLTLTDGGGNTVTLTEGNEYTKRNGSIIVTLKESYLNTLPVGGYTLSARITGGLYDGHTVSSLITVTAEAPTSAQAPKTGDGGAPGLWLGLCGLSLGGLAGLGALALRRKRNSY